MDNTDILFEVFSRLPVKSLLRFSCVCSQWRTIISDPHFIRTRHARSSVNPMFLISVSPWTWREYYRNTDPKRYYFLVDNPKPETHNQHVFPELCGTVLINPRPFPGYPQSSGGLIVFESTDAQLNKWITVFNPSTRERSSPWLILQRRSESRLKFGLDPVEGNIKILQPSMYGSVISTLGADREWRKSYHPPGLLSESEPDPFRSICINGVIYYMVMFPDRYSVVAFNLSSETLRIIELPDSHKRLGGQVVDFLGHLAIVSLHYDLHYHWRYLRSVEVWSYEDKEWTHHKRLPSPTSARLNLDFMGFTRVGELLLGDVKWLSDPYILFMYNIEECSVRKLKLWGLLRQLPYMFSSFVIENISEHVENLRS